MRRVLLVGTFMSTSDHNHSVGEELAERLRQAGWQVLMTSHATGRLKRVVDMVGTAWRHRDAYDVAQVDVYSGKAFVWAEAVCATLRRARKPYVLTLHGGNLPVFARRWPGRVRHLLGSAVTVTVPSRYLHEQMAPYRGDLQLVPNPIDMTSYPFRLRATVAPRLVWLRAFHQIYNPTLAIEVAARLRTDYPDLKLVMVGPDKDGSLGTARKRAEQLDVLGAVIFTGGVPHDRVASCLGEGDVFINTTNIDNTPVSVLEAMACGLPVVSTNVGGIPYLLREEHDALLVPPNDPAAMAAAVRRILDDPALGERLSRQGRAMVEEMAWERVLPHWTTMLAQDGIFRSTGLHGRT